MRLFFRALLSLVRQPKAALRSLLIILVAALVLSSLETVNGQGAEIAAMVIWGIGYSAATYFWHRAAIKSVNPDAVKDASPSGFGLYVIALLIAALVTLVLLGTVLSQTEQAFYDARNELGDLLGLQFMAPMLVYFFPLAVVFVVICIPFPAFAIGHRRVRASIRIYALRRLPGISISAFVVCCLSGLSSELLFASSGIFFSTPIEVIVPLASFVQSTLLFLLSVLVTVLYQDFTEDLAEKESKKTVDAFS